MFWPKGSPASRFPTLSVPRPPRRFSAGPATSSLPSCAFVASPLARLEVLARSKSPPGGPPNSEQLCPQAVQPSASKWGAAGIAQRVDPPRQLRSPCGWSADPACQIIAVCSLYLQQPHLWRLLLSAACCRAILLRKIELQWGTSASECRTFAECGFYEHFCVKTLKTLRRAPSGLVPTPRGDFRWFPCSFAAFDMHISVGRKRFERQRGIRQTPTRHPVAKDARRTPSRATCTCTQRPGVEQSRHTSKGRPLHAAPHAAAVWAKPCESAAAAPKPLWLERRSGVSDDCRMHPLLAAASLMQIASICSLLQSYFASQS